MKTQNNQILPRVYIHSYLSLPLVPPSTPHLLLLTSAGNMANLRAWAMPTYSLRRARFNTSKCCNASQLTLIIKACASPVLSPTTPYIQSTRLGVWASVLTCREQHSSSYHRSSMLIVASWEEINKAIKGDITVCLGPHAHILFPHFFFLPPPPSVGPVYEGVWWLVGATERSVVWGFDPRMRRPPWECRENGGVGPLTHLEKKWIF